MELFNSLWNYLTPKIELALEKNRQVEKLPEFYKISGNFLGRNWELDLILDGLKVFSKDGFDGYVFVGEYLNSYSIETNLSDLNVNEMSKELFLKYSSFEYPIIYNNAILDLGDYINSENGFDYRSLGLIYIDSNNSTIKDELNKTHTIFTQDILPNIQDLVIEFNDSIESESVLMVHDFSDTIDYFITYNKSINFVTINITKSKTISNNAYNYYTSSLVYQIEKLLECENINLKVDLIDNKVRDINYNTTIIETIRIYYS